MNLGVGDKTVGESVPCCCFGLFLVFVDNKININITRSFISHRVTVEYDSIKPQLYAFDESTLFFVCI